MPSKNGWATRHLLKVSHYGDLASSDGPGHGGFKRTYYRSQILLNWRSGEELGQTGLALVGCSVHLICGSKSVTKMRCQIQILDTLSTPYKPSTDENVSLLRLFWFFTSIKNKQHK